MVRPLKIAAVIPARFTTRSTAPRSIGSLGIPKTTHEDSSWARVNEVAPLLTHFSQHEKLSTKEIAELRKLIDAIEKKGR